MKQINPKTSANFLFGRQENFPVKETKTGDDDLLSVPYSHHPNVIAEALGVDAEEGLSSDEAAGRLQQGGLNVLEQTGGLSWWRILLGQFSSIVVWLLAVASVIAWLTNGFLEASAILVVLVINAAIGFAIEWRAGQALDALRRQTRTTAKVKRDGREKIIDAAELVVGDIISLTVGMRVPADARLIEAVSLRADESTLTGESVAVEKSIEAVNFASILAERRSMLYLGTMIVGGRALAIVTATGAYTELGRIGQLIAKTDAGKTPLERRLADLGRLLVYIVIGIAFFVMLAGFLRGDELWLMLEVSISLAVAAVPEGLPAMTTLILALGVLRMARRHALVRKLSAVETLGSTTVICTDKTGTLTENRMTVQEYCLSDGRTISFSEQAKIKSFGKISDEWQNSNFLRLLLVSMLCNDASFSSRNAEEQAIGDPTETALLVAVDKLGFDIENEKPTFKKLLERPFDAAAKRMITVLQDRDGEQFAAMKGAPAIVLRACSYFIGANGARLPLDDETRRQFLKTNEAMASRALRVLAFADKPLKNINCKEIRENDSGVIENGYTFLGFAGMSDPARAGAAAAVREAQNAGIRVVMLTGDQLMTARAIARELHLSQDENVFALHADEMTGADGEQLSALARRAHVFARVSPEDKLRIVEALQQSGEIVAVTGDGINDAPALKKANIGIAMGMRGTEVAKEASDVVLADDNFSTIINAIEGGRVIYANIIKFVHLMFSHNIGEVLVIFTAIFAGFPLPLLPLQILWINLVTDVFPALALAVEPPAPETMRRRPRSPDETLLSARFLILMSWQGALLASISLAAYFWALETYGAGAHARTVAMLALVGVQLGHLFNCRSRTRSALNGLWRSPFIFAAAAIVILLQLFAIYFAPLARVLDIIQPNKMDWLITLICVFLPIAVVETTKVFARGKQR